MLNIDLIGAYDILDDKDLKEAIKIFKRNLKKAKEENNNHKIVTCEYMINGLTKLLDKRKEG